MYLFSSQLNFALRFPTLTLICLYFSSAAVVFTIGRFGRLQNEWNGNVMMRQSNFSHHRQDVVMWLSCRGSRTFERSRGNDWMSDLVQSWLVALTHVPKMRFVSVTSYYKFYICFLNPHFTHLCRDAERTCLRRLSSVSLVSYLTIVTW